LECVGWIHLAQDGDQWQAVVKMGFMKWEICWLAKQL
jgi:hypothetical protein